MAVEQSVEPIFLSSIQAPRVNRDRQLWRRQPPAMDRWTATHLVVFVTSASLLHPVLVFSKQEDLKCSSSFLRAGDSYRDVVFSGK